jgi:hypothetical protein
MKPADVYIAQRRIVVMRQRMAAFQRRQQPMPEPLQQLFAALGTAAVEVEPAPLPEKAH